MPPSLAGASRVLPLTARCMTLGAEAAADLRVYRLGFWHGKLFFSFCLCNIHLRGLTTLVGRSIFLSHLFTLFHQYTYLYSHVHLVVYHSYPLHIPSLFLSYITSLVHLFIPTYTSCGTPFISHTYFLILSFSLVFYVILQFTCFNFLLSLFFFSFFRYIFHSFTSLLTPFSPPFHYFYFSISPHAPQDTYEHLVQTI